MNDEYVSAYAIAKICGYNGSFNDFNIVSDDFSVADVEELYENGEITQEDINEEISEEEPTLAKVSASTNPFRRHSPF